MGVRGGSWRPRKNFVLVQRLIPFCEDWALLLVFFCCCSKLSLQVGVVPESLKNAAAPAHS